MLERIQVPSIEVDTETVDEMVRATVESDARVQSVVPLAMFSKSTVLRVSLEGGQQLVCKLRRGGGGLDDFEREAYQLSYLADRARLPVPEVLAYREFGEFSVMVRAYIEAVPWERFYALSPASQRGEPQEQLGEYLGRTHAELTAVQYHQVLPDSAREYDSWPELYGSLWEERIEAVLASDRLDSLTVEAIEWIHQNLGVLLDIEDRPRLIHGSLSASNILCRQGESGWEVGAFLDPVLCYGHHEVDLALVQLRCNVGDSFFDSYAKYMVVHDGYELRKYVYMLYAVLDNVRVFGNTHHILSAIDCSREVLQRCGS